MNPGTFFIFMTTSLLFFSIVIAGCSSHAPPVLEVSPFLTSPPRDKTHELAPGDTAIISSPDGGLEVTVQVVNATTGKIIIEEKNTGTAILQYDPILWLQDGEGVNYTTVYCHADRCPGYVFLTTLPPQATEKRDFDNLYENFQVPVRGRQGRMIFYWSYNGQEASWIIIPA